MFVGKNKRHLMGLIRSGQWSSDAGLFLHTSRWTHLRILCVSLTHIYSPNSLFNSSRGSSHFFIHHVTQFVFPDIHPFRPQILKKKVRRGKDQEYCTHYLHEREKQSVQSKPFTKISFMTILKRIFDLGIWRKQCCPVYVRLSKWFNCEI